jgi:hypothetical protein
MFKNPFVKKILSALGVAGLGFVLLNVTFLFDFLFQSLIRGFIRLFIPVNPEMDFNWFPPLMHGSFLIVIGLLTFAIFRSKLSVFLKAVYMPVPVAMGLATLGIFLYPWPVAVYSLGALACLGVLYYFFRTKQPWLYYYAVILFSLTLAIFTLSGGEI